MGNTNISRKTCLALQCIGVVVYSTAFFINVSLLLKYVFEIRQKCLFRKLLALIIIIIIIIIVILHIAHHSVLTLDGST